MGWVATLAEGSRLIFPYVDADLRRARRPRTQRDGRLAAKLKQFLFTPGRLAIRSTFGDVRAILIAVPAEGSLDVVHRRRRPNLQLATLSRRRRPRLVVMLADTDAGSVITAAQSGAQWGYRLLLLQFVLIPILYIVQELTVRLGVATGKGHAELIKQHFGPAGPGCRSRRWSSPASARCSASFPAWRASAL